MSDKISRILNVVIVILTVGLFCMGAYLYNETKPRMSYSRVEPAGNMIRRLERGDYNGLVETMYYNKMGGATVDTDSSYAVPYAAADYYEAAFLYYAYAKSGDTGKASEYKEAMDKLRSSLGDYSYIADEIDTFLN